MSARGITAIDSSFELRMNASSVGLTAVRVATAAARRRQGLELSPRDERAVQIVIDDLRSEIKVLRGEATPDVDDEKSYAFANFALTALGTYAAELKPDGQSAARELEHVVSTLESLRTEVGQPSEMEELERLFLRASEAVSNQLGSSGEILSGTQAYVVRR